MDENELCGHFSLAETLLNDAKTKKKVHKSKKKAENIWRFAKLVVPLHRF